MTNINQIIEMIPVEDQAKWLRNILDIKPLKLFVAEAILTDLDDFNERFKNQRDFGIQNKTDYLIAEFIRSDYFKSYRDSDDLDFLITKLEISLQ